MSGKVPTPILTHYYPLRLSVGMRISPIYLKVFLKAFFGMQAVRQRVNNKVKFYQKIRLFAVLCLIPMAMIQVARESWWDRTSKTTVSTAFHRVRSDLSPALTRSAAEGIDRSWIVIDVGLGQLRPRSRGLQQALLFASHEDLAETMRSRFAVDAPSDAFAFFSPLGQGVAVCTEDTPVPFASRGLSAAIGSEYLRLSCGADLSPVLQAGITDFLARRDSKGVGGGIGEAGIAVIRKCVADSKAVSMFDLLSMNAEAWKQATAQDASGALREESASVVRFLMRTNGPTNAGLFQQYLRLVAEGTPSFEAFCSVYGLRNDRGWSEFNAQWQAFALKEKVSPTETVLERLAFLAEGMRALDRDGALPTDFAALTVALKDRNFVSPSEWRSGFSQIRASDTSAFTPTDPYESSGGAKPTSTRSKPSHFEFEIPKKGQESDPPSILAVDIPGERMKVVWIKTRPEPEAPWVWDISR